MLKSSLAAILVMAVSSAAIAKVDNRFRNGFFTWGGDFVYPGPAPSAAPSVSSRVATGSSDYSQIQAMQEEIQQLRGIG